MTNPSQRRLRHRGRIPRGVSLIEGLVASMVLLVGLVGVLQGVIFASTQNSMAGRITRASAIARQTMMSLQARGRARLMAASGALGSTYCATAPSAALQKAAGSLYPATTNASFSSFTPCWVDLDAYDATAGVADKILPGFAADEAAVFKRTIVVYSNSADTSVSYVGIGLSWREVGVTRSHHQFFALYDSTVTQTGGVDL